MQQKENDHFRLEVKHIAPYLPYELYFMRLERICLDRTVIPVIWSDEYEFVRTQLNPVTLNGFKYEENKLILRPLSDLTLEYCMVNDLSNVTSVLCGQSSEFILKHTSYQDIEKLISLHFDVFGLIEKGLAIDINKLVIEGK